MCGKVALEARRGEFHFTPPPEIPGGEMLIPDATWEVCSACGEQMLPPALGDALLAERYRRLGLLSPGEIAEIRERLGLTQVEIAEFLGVGEKTYARWESGRSIHNISSDNLIRLVAQSPELFPRLRAQRDPDRQKLIGEYVQSLPQLKGGSSLALAAHGGDLDPAIAEALRKRLLEIVQSRKEG
ncbi:MAG TPA: type II TA system antitoxin MqsA family protein [Phycisphaerae bacterium]|nr:type II TA system antitoxin MqsA family protein [Phycisphaerae bacterium]